MLTIFLSLFLFLSHAAESVPHPCQNEVAIFCSGLSIEQVKEADYRCLDFNFPTLGRQCQKFVFAAISVSQPCLADSLRLCGEGIGVERSLRSFCLKDHLNNLSVACKSSLAKTESYFAQEKAACSGEHNRLCAANKIPLLSCYKETIVNGQLAESCKKVLITLYPERFSLQALQAQQKLPPLLAHCEREASKFCQNLTVEQVTKQNYKCLDNSLNLLSPDCLWQTKSFIMLGNPCLEDLIKLCPRSDWLPDKRIACLRLHTKELSVTCREQVK